jgi:hypothetical protein
LQYRHRGWHGFHLCFEIVEAVSAWHQDEIRCFCRARDVAGARPRFERALAIWEKTRGPDHPDTALGLENLALVLRDQGDLAGAVSLAERAISRRCHWRIRRQAGQTTHWIRRASAPRVRIPMQSGRGFRFDVGRRSDLIPATIPN